VGADITIRITRGIIQIPIETTCIQAIIPIPAEMSDFKK